MENITGWLKDLMESFQGSNERGARLSRGDVIGISRGIYSHYGVYADDGSVIHYSSEDSDLGMDAVIRETDLDGFTRGDAGLFKLSFPPAHRRPSRTPLFFPRVLPNFPRGEDLLACEYRLYSSEETVARARSRLGENRYNLLLNNCEHFAIWCKTGVSESWQVNALMDMLRSSVFKTIIR